MENEAPQTAMERRRLALDQMDNAKFSWYHVRAIIVAGVGLYAISYVANLVIPTPTIFLLSTLRIS